VKALEAIRKLKNDRETCNQVGRVDIVVGLENPNSLTIPRAAERIPEAFVHQSVYSLAPLARQADLVLTAGGNTMVEALALRKPCIVTITGNNQTLMVNDLDSEGVIRSLGEHAAVRTDDVLTMIKCVLNDFDAFAARIVSKGLFDHLGAKRIASAMLELSQDSVL
jgi:spore coat polysaccharide biosynthesis predicted glycosyltransferase SpsG